MEIVKSPIESGIPVITQYYPVPVDDAKMIAASCLLWTLAYCIVLVLPLPLKPAHL